MEPSQRNTAKTREFKEVRRSTLIVGMSWVLYLAFPHLRESAVFCWMVYVGSGLLFLAWLLFGFVVWIERRYQPPPVEPMREIDREF